MYQIEISANELLYWAHGLLDILLCDHTTKGNIIWATDDYANLGDGYSFHDQIRKESITGKRNGVIRPRVTKHRFAQIERARTKAEVFTPSWLCNLMLNDVDARLFGRTGIFNDATKIQNTKAWHPTADRIVFPAVMSWQDYVNKNVLEITCGEAPFLISRYDSVTGVLFKNLNQRVGLLDRKLRVVTENNNSKEDWMYWAKIAFQSAYGYEWQGDNLFLARVNMLLTLYDYYKTLWHESPPMDYVCEIAHIISWNLWQMDGLKYVLPNSCHTQYSIERDLEGNEVKRTEIPCPGCKKGLIHKHNGIYANVMDWETNTVVRADKMLERR